jgi:DNA-binding CsgD family transcriptional regulator
MPPLSLALTGLLERLHGANFVAASQQVQAMNRCAQDLAQEGTLLRVDQNNKLAFARPASQSAYRKALKSALDAASGGFSACRVGSAAGRLADLQVLQLSPWPPAQWDAGAALFLITVRWQGEQAELEENLLIRRYNLSKAEAAVVIQFAAGATLREIADARGVTHVAVRNQIAAAKQKLNLNRQAELIRLIDGLSPRMLLNQHNSEVSGANG